MRSNLKFKFFFLFLLSIPLGACAGLSPFSSKPDLGKDYALRGLDEQPELKDYTDKVLEATLYAPLEAEEADEKTRVIEWREKKTVDELGKALNAKGYYAHEIFVKEDSAKGGEPSVIFDIAHGPAFTIDAIDIKPESMNKYLEGLDLQTGDVLEAEKVLAAQAKLHADIQKESCAFVLDVSHRAILKMKEAKASVVFNIDKGKEASFGALKVNGLSEVKESYVRKVADWREGDCFRHDRIASVREKIMGTGLFSKVDVKLPEDGRNGGAIPVTLEVSERAQRSVKVGATYYTDTGPGVQFGWEHRNFFGAGEKFNSDLNLSMIEQSLDFDLEKPYFIRKDQSLSLSANASREETDAYDKTGVGFGGAVNRNFGRHTTASVGSDLDLSKITEDDGSDNVFGLLSSHAGVTYDTRDNTLDPHKGILASAKTEPFVDVLGQSNPFIKSVASAQSYLALHDRFVLAGRMKLGSIMGGDNANIPATQRFYSGGGGSVRGFTYQGIGPKENGAPIGGVSLAEAALETRFKVKKKFGGVLFVDAGQVGEDQMPDFSNISAGAGAGFRYYTDFGPVRFDVGVPISGKESTDQNYQFYISIGQAF